MSARIMRKRLMNLNMLLLLALLVVALLAFLLYSQQRRLLYFPDTTYAAPRDLNLAGVEEVVVKTRDTQRLLAWYAPAPEGRPTILYFHGNAGSLVGRVGRLQFWREQGYGVLMTTYRGYSGSSGFPAETPIKMDALYFYHWLQARGVAENRIVIYGESLGTGVAVSTALNHHPAAVILEAPYSSIADVAAARFWPFPVRPFVKDAYDSERLIGGVTAPVLMVHGEKDRVVPIRFARKLFEAASPSREAAWLRNADHHNLYSEGAFDIINRFINRHI